jgi:glycosyltransferase involved in cell wall biosynthesis
MRIAQVAPLAESVPPRLYGGTERVIAWLTEELIELGHQVTLIASGDSHTRADLIAAWPRALRLGRPRSDPLAAQTVLLDLMADHAKDFDVVHCHTDWLHLPLLSRLNVPFVTTLHGRLDLPGLPKIVERFPNAPFISISENQRIPLPGANWLGTVYHGLPSESLSPSFKAGKYLAFLGRLTPDKGPEAAIRIARESGLPLRIAAKVPRSEKGYFKEKIAPLVDGNNVELSGEVNDKSKEDFLANAIALIFPIDWPEPFGLVMIEAIACGTPVIAFARGSVPEVIEDGVTGFIVKTEDEAVNAIKRLPKLDRRRIRMAFEQKFTARQMAENYVRHYQLLLHRFSTGIHREIELASGAGSLWSTRTINE